MSDKRIEVDVSATPQRLDVQVGGSTGDMEAVQRLLQAAAQALANMGKWEAAQAIAKTLPAGSIAEARLDLTGTAPLFEFGVPVGPEGRQGPPGEAGGINIYKVEVPVGADGWAQREDELYEKTVAVSGVKAGDTVRVSADVLIMEARMPDTEHLTLAMLDAPTEAFTAVLTIGRNGYGMTSDIVEVAERLRTPRAIELRGHVAGAAEFDGSEDAIIYTAVDTMSNEDLEVMLK